MAAPSTRVDIFYDVVSPYSWLAFEGICRYRKLWNMDLKLRPFFLGGIMKATGNKPPMMVMVPTKAIYMEKDVERSAAYFQVPLNRMEDPFGTIIEKSTIRAQRLLTAISFHCPQHLEEASRQLWMKIWSRGEGIYEDESFRQVGKSSNMSEADIEHCIKLIDSPDIKEALKATTEEAINLGVFGAPTIVVYTKNGPEIFFGADRLPFIAMLLNEHWQGPVPSTALKSAL